VELQDHRIKAKSEIEITNLHRRAIHRFVEEEAKQQENMEAITGKAIPLLQDDSDPNRIEDDWVTNFFDKSRIVSDIEMQDLWSAILAGEANTPGTYSKRTVNFLGDLDKRDAELFMTLCSFGWFIDKFTPLIFDMDAAIYNDNGLNFDKLSHLDSIGLIQLNKIGGFSKRGLPKIFTALYYGQPLTLTMKNETNNKLSVGKVLPTQTGVELARVCKAPSVEGFIDYVKEKWRAHLPDSENTEPIAGTDT